MEWFEKTEHLSIADIAALSGKYRADSLVVAIEAILIDKDESAAELTESELNFLAIEALEREVNNGGFSQLFANESRRFVPLLNSALETIGASRTRALVERAISALRLDHSLLGSEPMRYLESMYESMEDPAIQDQLGELDAEYYELGEDLASALLSYTCQNIREFKSA
ncbi:MAG: DUF4375 domain-containing protein [Planctomycetaceae bacterium]|nr:DUF4375 domain-containing protein [Planctomycetaceae bacterium]